MTAEEETALRQALTRLGWRPVRIETYLAEARGIWEGAELLRRQYRALVNYPLHQVAELDRGAAVKAASLKTTGTGTGEPYHA